MSTQVEPEKQPPIEDKLKKLAAEVAPQDWPTGPAPHVYTAIADVSKDLAEVGVGKSRENKQQGFKFRGVDDVYQVLATLLPKHGLVILPRVLSRAMTERKSSAGNTLFSVVCEVEYSLVSTKDGSEHVVRFIGEGMDTGDKATNKAVAIAYKYMAFQVFCIPLEGAQDDPDADSHKVEGSDHKTAAPPPDTKKPVGRPRKATNAAPDSGKRSADGDPSGHGDDPGFEPKTIDQKQREALWAFARKLAPEKADHDALIKALLAKNNVANTTMLVDCGDGGTPPGIYSYLNWLDDEWRRRKNA